MWQKLILKRLDFWPAINGGIARAPSCAVNRPNLISSSKHKHWVSLNTNQFLLCETPIHHCSLYLATSSKLFKGVDFFPICQYLHVVEKSSVLVENTKNFSIKIQTKRQVPKFCIPIFSGLISISSLISYCCVMQNLSWHSSNLAISEVFK